MDESKVESGAPVAGSKGKSLAQRLARLWVGSSHGKLRLLRAESIPLTGPVLLVLNSAPSFMHVAAVSGALERPVRFVLPEGECRGFWPRRLAGPLGVILHGSSPTDQAAVRAAASRALAAGEAVAVFAQPETARSESLSPSCVVAAKLVLDVGSSRAGSPGAMIIPLHVLGLNEGAKSGDILLTAGSPLSARSYLGGASAESSLRTLAGELEYGLAENPYRLEERDIRFFLADLEKTLRSELEDDWASRLNWKQKTEGFEISRLIIEWAEQVNTLDPARLIGLRVELENYREQLRQWSLAKAEAEMAGEWLKLGASRARYWIEAIVEAPVALYGLISHVIPLALFAPGSFLRRLANTDSGHAWLLRVLVLLGSYIVQVSFCARWWGRAAAGYYALTLPISGLVLWRFARLARTRIRLLLLAQNLPRRAEKLRRLRRRFIEHLNQARDEYADTMITPQQA